MIMSKRCPDCGFVNEDSRIFCAACGEALDQQTRLIQNLERQKNAPAKPQEKPADEPAPKPAKKYDDSDEDLTPIKAKKSGCYVAPAVYGSYDCPQVWTLRRFRDNQLAASLPGRAFIRLYYAVSPTLVRWFGETKWFQRLWRGPLDRMVAKLQAQGVESTPYEDKIW